MCVWNFYEVEVGVLGRDDEGFQWAEVIDDNLGYHHALLLPKRMLHLTMFHLIRSQYASTLFINIKRLITAGDALAQPLVLESLLDEAENSNKITVFREGWN